MYVPFREFMFQDRAEWGMGEKHTHTGGNTGTISLSRLSKMETNYLNILKFGKLVYI